MIALFQGRCIRAFACLAAAIAAAPLRAASCDIDPQAVSFGAYDPTDGDDLDGVGNIGIDCDAVVSFYNLAERRRGILFLPNDHRRRRSAGL